MKHYPDLLLLFTLLSVTTMIKAQISIRPYSEWEATQFVAVNGHQPEDYVTPDNNWEILYNLRTPRTQAELREMGIKCSDSQLLLLEVGGLVSKTKGKWKATIQPDSAANSPHSTLHSQLIKWYDHEAHTHFDVCADDHCQRYQGITRASTPQANEAVSATRGEVLMYEGKICDARFSKCCGGAMEEFQNCWENVRHPYLTGKRDYIPESHASDSEKQITGPAIQLPDLTQEEEADRWIRTSPDAFCNTQDKKILSQVLKYYDQETTDFYRWKFSYSQQDLAELIHLRSGIDFGEIIDLIPVERGTSGRLIRLKIVGTLRTLTIGKEIEIRRTLSPSHLYSSAFLVDKEKGEEGNVPTRFTLTGAGWGHGVGLCQIGAAVMGERGYYYKDILAHYYPGSRLENQYE